MLMLFRTMPTRLPPTFSMRLFGPDVHGLRIAAILDDLHGHIHFAGQNGSITDAHDRRGIKEHEIIARLEFADKRFHLARTQDAQRTARGVCRSPEIQRWQRRGLDDFIKRVLFEQIVREPRVVGDTQNLV